MGALVGEGSSVFYHPTHLFFTPGLLWGRCCGSTDRAPAPVQHQGSAGSLLCFASLFYPKKLWEIGKNLELGMVVLPGGFTLRVGDEKKPSVVAQDQGVLPSHSCPHKHCTSSWGSQAQGQWRWSSSPLYPGKSCWHHSWMWPWLIPHLAA